MSSRRSIRPLRFLLALAVVAACTVGGVVGGLLVGGRTVQETSLATIESRVVPSRHGHVTIYVPLVDWRVELLDLGAPVNIELELRGIDRSSAGSSVSSRDAARRSLAQVRSDSRVVMRETVQRGLIAGSVGGIVGGIVGGALVGALLQRRRWLLGGVLVGIAVTGAVVGGSTIAIAGVDGSRVDTSSIGGDAAELPQALRFARQLLVVGDEYERHYETALSSVANLTEFTRRQSGPPTSSAFVVSDIHDNVFILDAFSRFAGDRTVFAVGDFGQVGAQVETRTAPKIAGLGGRVVAVSGNHDSAGYMRSLERAGATVLAGDVGTEENQRDVDVTMTVDGLRVAGYRDPLERRDGSDGSHVLRVYGEQYDRQADDLIAWFDDLPTRPDVLLVHQHGLAHRLVEHLRETDAADAPPLAIFTGHDHDPHVNSYEGGRLVVVDGGSLGAGGPFAIGEQEASFAKIDIAGTRVISVDLVSIDPTTGNASSKRIPIG